MSRQIQEIETLLAALVGEHWKMLKLVEDQQVAMKKLDLNGMDAVARIQEAARLRIGTLETKRRLVVAQLTKLHSFQGVLRIDDIAKLYPHHAVSLRKLRDELKTAIGEVSKRTHVASRIAGALLGHLNTVVRLVAGVVEKAGVYTKHGVPQVSGRIGMMDAMG
jgi:hypothetical protein